MRAEEFGGWKANNVGKGGKKSSYDAFNKSMKGHERNPSAKEFYNQGLDEYHHYSERMDTRDEKKKDDSKSNSSQRQSKKSNSSKVTNKSSSFVRNIVSKVVMAVVGAVVVVNEYQVIKQHKEERLSTVASVTFSWSGDKQSATLGLFNIDEGLIKELPTTVYISQEDPTCTSDGKITYVATAVDEDGKKYTETQTDILPQLPHDYELIEETKLENGNLKQVWKCSECGHTVIWEVSAEEKD